MFTDNNFLFSPEFKIRRMLPQIEKEERVSLGRKIINLDLNKASPDQGLFIPLEVSSKIFFSSIIFLTLSENKEFKGIC